MEELGKALQLIFQKVADFFDIFDLSFFVSGIASATAVAMYLSLAGFSITGILDSTLGVFVVALSCYALGLTSFASGRYIRMELLPRLRREGKDAHILQSNLLFKEALDAHGLSEKYPFEEYLSDSRDEFQGIRRLYVLLWAEVRQSECMLPSLQLLKSYWVKAATFDGIAVSMLIWASVACCYTFGLGIPKSSNLYLGLTITVALVLLFLACVHEAARYHRYQVEEVVATIAAAKSPISDIGEGTSQR